MTSAEVGIFLLLCYAWFDEGLPNDRDELAMMVGESRSAFEKAWTRVGRCFEVVDDRLVQPRLERVRAEQSEYRDRQSQAGKAGAEKRWRADSSPIVTSSSQNGDPIFPRLASAIPKHKSAPAPASANTSSLREAAEAAPKTRYEKTPCPSHLPEALPPDVADLAIVAADFLPAFGNVTTPKAREKHGSEYVGVLAAFRGRGCSTAEAWSAFGDARIANNGRPLFGAEAKKAISFAPSRPSLRVVGGADAPRGPYAGVPQTIAAEDRQ